MLARLMISAIESKLRKVFDADEVTVTDNSPGHAAHLEGSAQALTHVHVTIVSKYFDKMSILDRHKKVYSALKQEILSLHAISIRTLTPEEAQQ